MLPPYLFRALLAASLVLAAPLGAETIGFDEDPLGQTPTGWQAGCTGAGKPVWTVERNASAPSAPKVLHQSGSGQFPWCVLDASNVLNGVISVKFKPVSGREDQAAGLVWRFRDGNNYYVVRANALEDNVVLYKVENGRRIDLKPAGAGANAYGVKAPVRKNDWNTLRVEFSGRRFSASLNGVSLFDVDDSTFTTAGKVGVWTKADSDMLFDDFVFQSR